MINATLQILIQVLLIIFLKFDDMKRIFFIITIAAAFVLNGCIKNEDVIWKGSQIEFDAAIWNSNGAGLTYPILTRVPAQGTATGSGQPTLTRTSGSVQIRVNLVGAQRSSPTNFTYQVVGAESTAVAGTHYTAPSGTGTIPANSSFGIITIDILTSTYIGLTKLTMSAGNSTTSRHVSADDVRGVTATARHEK